MCCILHVLLSVFLLKLFVSPLTWSVLFKAVEVWSIWICEYSECVEEVDYGCIFSASVNVLRNDRFLWSLFRISSAACVHLGILFVLVFVVYCESFHVMSIFHVVWISGFHFFCIGVFWGFWRIRTEYFLLRFWWPERKERPKETLNVSWRSPWCFRILVLNWVVVLQFSLFFFCCFR